MDRSRRKEKVTLAQAQDTSDLESVIASALASSPVDIVALRRGVWTYVGEERHVRTSPGVVILRLTEMIDASPRTTALERAAITKQMILWCVEAYFGQLGGDLVPTADIAAP
jgi:hypothetical protein